MKLTFTLADGMPRHAEGPEADLRRIAANILREARSNGYVECRGDGWDLYAFTPRAIYTGADAELVGTLSFTEGGK